MARIQVIALALAVLSPACGGIDEPVPSAVAVARERFVGGEVQRYRFEWTVDGAGVAGGMLPDDGRLAAGVHFAGEARLRVLGRAGDDIVLGATFERLDAHEISLLGQNLLPSAAPLLDREVLFTVDEDGRARAVYFERDTPSVLRQMMVGFLVQTDLYALPQDATPQVARVPAGAGLADVEYSWATPHRLVRTLRAYARFDAVATDAMPTLEGRVELALDEHALPRRIDGEEVVWVPSESSETPLFDSRTRFVLERLEATTESPVAMPDLTTLDRRDLAAPPDDTEARRLTAQRFAEGLEIGDIAMQVRSATAGAKPPPGFMVRATGLLRGWPEKTEELRELWAMGEGEGGRTLVLDVLSSAGTPEAQEIMCEVLATPWAREQDAYAAWVQRFALVDEPTSASAEFLLADLERVRDDDDDRTFRALLHPMGSVARRIADVDPAAAAALHAKVALALDDAETDELVVAAIAGLGNAAAPEDLPRLLERSHDPDPGIRGGAALAMRLFRDDAASSRLLAMISDREPYVAAAALSSLDRYQRSRERSAGLASIVLLGAYEPSLEARLVYALGRRIGDDPVVAAALVAMRARTRDAKERDRIDRLLGRA